MNNVRVLCISTFNAFCDILVEGISEYGRAEARREGRLEYPGRSSCFSQVLRPRYSYHPFSVIGRDLDSLTQALRSRGRNLGTRLRKRARVGLRFTEKEGNLHRVAVKTVNQENVERLAPYETEESGNKNPSFSDLKSGKASGFTTETVVANRETETVRSISPIRALEVLTGRSDPEAREDLPTNGNQAPQTRNKRSPLGLSKSARCNNPRFIGFKRSCAPSCSLLDKGRTDKLRFSRKIEAIQGAIQKLEGNRETQQTLFSQASEMVKQKKSFGPTLPKATQKESEKIDSKDRERIVCSARKELELVQMFGSRTAPTCYQSKRGICLKCREREAYWSATWCPECIWEFVRK